MQAPKKLKAVNIKTMPYPGFPTDMQAIFASMLTVSKGTSVVIENIFENRYKYANELQRMGAKFVIDGRTALIKGVRKLNRGKCRGKRFKRRSFPCNCRTCSKGKNLCK